VVVAVVATPAPATSASLVMMNTPKVVVVVAVVGGSGRRKRKGRCDTGRAQIRWSSRTVDGALKVLIADRALDAAHALFPVPVSTHVSKWTRECGETRALNTSESTCAVERMNGMAL
jgi:hypothetical protein